MDGQSINGASEPNAEDTFYKYDLFHGRRKNFII